jgi:hypothetical protein
MNFVGRQCGERMDLVAEIAPVERSQWAGGVPVPAPRGRRDDPDCRGGVGNRLAQSGSAADVLTIRGWTEIAYLAAMSRNMRPSQSSATVVMRSGTIESLAQQKAAAGSRATANTIGTLLLDSRRWPLHPS